MEIINQKTHTSVNFNHVVSRVVVEILNLKSGFKVKNLCGVGLY